MIQPKNIYGWNGFEFTSPDLKVGITPSIGGRIMSLMYQGHEILFVNPDHMGETFNPHDWSDLTQAKKSLGFRLWGGDKTWVAPEKGWLLGMPSLDIDAAPYSIRLENNEAVMTSPVCRETGVQIVRRVSLVNGEVHLTEELYNRTNGPLQKGLWNVAQVKRPCVFEIPSLKGAFRSYHHQDPTLASYPESLEPHQGVIEVDCRHNNLFKIGGMPSSDFLKVYLLLDGQKTICWEKTFTYDPRSQYAHDSVVEAYNSIKYPYSEIELHAPFKVLGPGEFVQLKQVWKISSCSSKGQALE